MAKIIELLVDRVKPHADSGSPVAKNSIEIIEKDYKVIEDVYHFGKTAHAGQKRLSGEDYFLSHSIGSTEILLGFVKYGISIDLPLIIATPLHDTPEMTSYTLKDIESSFGSEVAGLVEGVTKIPREAFSSEMLYIKTNLEKRLQAFVKDPRTSMENLADRSHNIKTLMYKPFPDQIRIANETIRVYVPIAYSLGLEDIGLYLYKTSLKYLNKIKNN